MNRPSNKSIDCNEQKTINVENTNNGKVVSKSNVIVIIALKKWPQTVSYNLEYVNETCNFYYDM